jgi:hypothetical protein
VQRPNKEWLFAGPVVGIDTGVVAVLAVTTVVEVEVVVDDVDVVSADELAPVAVARPNAECALPVDDAWVGRVPVTAAAAVPAPRTATVATAAALAERTLVSNASPL